MTNTERLIASSEYAAKHGIPSITYMVGKYTGNSPSVTNALRNRGYRVEKAPAGGVVCYRLFAKQELQENKE